MQTIVTSWWYGKIVIQTEKGYHNSYRALSTTNLTCSIMRDDETCRSHCSSSTSSCESLEKNSCTFALSSRPCKVMGTDTLLHAASWYQSKPKQRGSETAFGQSRLIPFIDLIHKDSTAQNNIQRNSIVLQQRHSLTAKISMDGEVRSVENNH